MTQMMHIIGLHMGNLLLSMTLSFFSEAPATSV
jgi:hypothetical protein